MAGRIVSFVPDILVEMRIDAAARGLGAELESVGAPEHLEKALDSGADVLVVDLGIEGLDLQWVTSVAKARNVPVIAFGPHVEFELLSAAEEAGMDEVYPRSAFMNGLPRILEARLRGSERPSG